MLKEPEKSRLQAERLGDMFARGRRYSIDEYGRNRALNAIRSLQSHQLRKASWYDALLQGSTLQLSPGEEAAVRSLFLGQFGIDIDGLLPEHGRPPTHRCRDELLCCRRHFLTKRVNKRQLQARVRRSRRLDATFWKRMP